LLVLLSFGFAPKQFGGKGPPQRGGAGDEFFRAGGPASFLSGAQRNGPPGRKLVKNSLEAFTPSGQIGAQRRCFGATIH
jgi:hypothetical protein